MRYTLQSTPTFNRWLGNLKDRTVKNLLLARLARVENGHLGDTRALAANLFELRCFFGGGLRVYFTIRHQQVILLLAAGDKSSQDRDIEKALALLHSLKP